MRARLPTNVLLVFVLLILPLPAAFCQDQGKPAQVNIYSLGQQTIAISAGLFIPLFFQSFSGHYSNTTNLSLGGTASLMWGIHLDNHWLVGLDIAGMFSQSVQKNFLWQVPICARGSYSFHVFPFEIPLYLDVGMDIVKYREQSHINFILKPGVSTLWKYNLSWGFGLNAVYWWVLQPWKPDPGLGRMGNFLDITATAQYAF